MFTKEECETIIAIAITNPMDDSKTYFKYKISPSMLFPTIETFDINKYNLLYNLLDTNNIEKINRDFLSQNIVLDKELLNANGLLDKIISIQEKIITQVEYDQEKIEEFRRIMNTEISNDVTKVEIFNSFI